MDIRPPDHTAAPSEHGKSGNPTVLRVVAWGVCASVAAALLVFVAQTPAGGERINQALAGAAEPAVTPADGEPMVRALEARIAALTSDRDRLAKRVAALESGVSDLTGSVRRQASSASSAAQPPAPAPVAAAPSLPPVMIVAVAPPLINPLATPPAGVASILPEPAAPRHVAAPSTEIPTPAKTLPDAMVPESGPPQASTPDEVPTGSIPPQAEQKSPEISKPAPHTRAQAEFGVELATEANMDGLRKRWAGVKANYGPLLVGLSPVAVRDQHSGSSNIRLVAGPLPSLAAARQLCARFARVNGDCWPARINPAEVVQR